MCTREDKVIVSVTQAMQELATTFRSPLPSAVLPNAILTIRDWSEMSGGKMLLKVKFKYKRMKAGGQSLNCRGSWQNEIPKYCGNVSCIQLYIILSDRWWRGASVSACFHVNLFFPKVHATQSCPAQHYHSALDEASLWLSTIVIAILWGTSTIGWCSPQYYHLFSVP